MAKFFLISIIFLIYVKTIQTFKSGKIHVMDFILWTIFWGIVTIFISYPQISQKIADLLGIGRGVDMIFYFSILALFFLFYNVFVQIKNIDEKLTKLGREISINTAIKKDD